MAKFITLGKYTAKGLSGFVSNPATDRKAATSALAASVGAKVTRYAGLRGKYDFLAEIEGTFEQAAAAIQHPYDSNHRKSLEELQKVHNPIQYFFWYLLFLHHLEELHDSYESLPS